MDPSRNVNSFTKASETFGRGVVTLLSSLQKRLMASSAKPETKKEHNFELINHDDTEVEKKASPTSHFGSFVSVANVIGKGAAKVVGGTLCALGGAGVALSSVSIAAAIPGAVIGAAIATPISLAYYALTKDKEGLQLGVAAGVAIGSVATAAVPVLLATLPFIASGLVLWGGLELWNKY